MGQHMVTVPKAMLTRLLRLAETTALHHEADKHEQDPDCAGYVEVQLLQQVRAVKKHVSPARTKKKTAAPRSGRVTAPVQTDDRSPPHPRGCRCPNCVD